MLAQHAGTFWEALRLYLSPAEVIRVRVTAKEFNDAKTYGPHAELYFFLLRSMSRETEHVSRNSPFFSLSFTLLADVGPSRWQWPLEGPPWSCERPQREAPRLLHAQDLHAPEHLFFFASDPHAAVILRVFLKVSSEVKPAFGKCVFRDGLVPFAVSVHFDWVELQKPSLLAWLTWARARLPPWSQS